MTALTVRVSLRPGPQSRVRSPTGDLRPRQGLELGMKSGLVPLCLQEKVCSTAGDLLGVTGLGMHRVGDEQDPGQAAQDF